MVLWTTQYSLKCSLFHTQMKKSEVQLRIHLMIEKVDPNPERADSSQRMD